MSKSKAAEVVWLPTNEGDAAYLLQCENGCFAEITLPSGTVVPTAPDGKQWRVVVVTDKSLPGRFYRTVRVVQEDKPACSPWSRSPSP